MSKQYEILEEILTKGYINPVYQPIVSLRSGEVMGYEALSRISRAELQLSIGTLFRQADRAGRLWELETLCRTKSLAQIQKKPKNRKLFLNVTPNIINDEHFKKGFTRRCLEEYGVDAEEEIVFEITERVAVSDQKVFLDSITHYRSQRYGIAVDDVGSGFSGLNMIVDVAPDFIKLDMNLVRDIDKDNMKISLCRAFVEFCRNENINLIAEGIETEAELKILTKLGVGFGQGYFLAPPGNQFGEPAPEITNLISSYFSKHYIEGAASSIFPSIGRLAKVVRTFPPEAKAVDLFELIKENPTINEICMVDEERIVGFLTRTALNEHFCGRYGYSLNYRKKIKDLMNTGFLRVGHDTPVDVVSRWAMQRPYEHIYNPIIVEKEGLFHGIVTVKSLLEACSKIQLDIAMQSNPLTGLPGNLMIENEVRNRLFGNGPFCITYYDLDNFKSYNDAYGFANGDLMLKMVSDILSRQARRKEFVGHIGGDDFIVIADYHDGQSFCRPVMETFCQEVLSLYHDEDIKNGFIVSKNRHGLTEKFPLTSLSVAGISNRKKQYSNMEDFSMDVARLKKICKQHSGNYFEIW
jgi:EAL domain-containing protein (putative c-di-GMP-specific phosphodiesterase class I)/GGDEF domain-containing protein